MPPWTVRGGIGARKWEGERTESGVIRRCTCRGSYRRVITRSGTGNTQVPHRPAPGVHVKAPQSFRRVGPYTVNDAASHRTLAPS